MSQSDQLVSYDTPWRTHEEFRQVYRWVYLSDPASSSMVDDLTLARDQMLVWTMRCPHFKHRLEIEGTIHFLNAVISDRETTVTQSSSSQDEFAFSDYFSDASITTVDSQCNSSGSDQSIHGELMLSSLFSTAVVKFCDLLKFYTIDYGSVKRLASRDTLGSLVEKSEKLGIPEWIIDARHEASHAALPSLDLLRHASFICMDWLNRHFWRPKAERQLDSLVDTAFHDIISRTENFKTSCSFVTKCLANESTHTMKLLTIKLIEMESVSVPPNLPFDWKPCHQPLISQEIFLSTMPLLRRILQAGQMHHLLMHLISHFDSLQTDQSIRSVFWFSQIISCMTCYKPKTKLTIHRKVLRSNLKFSLEYKNVLHALLMRPSHITKALVKHLKPLLPHARKIILDKILPAIESCHLTNHKLMPNDPRSEISFRG